jgi:hypothetical protein
LLVLWGGYDEEVGEPQYKSSPKSLFEQSGQSKIRIPSFKEDSIGLQPEDLGRNPSIGKSAKTAQVEDWCLTFLKTVILWTLNTL